MRIVETFLRGQQPKHQASPFPPKVRIDKFIMSELEFDTSNDPTACVGALADSMQAWLITRRAGETTIKNKERRHAKFARPRCGSPHVKQSQQDPPCC
jgi:hypothetical protein